jgi:predicted ArsR family transcriptional regulator
MRLTTRQMILGILEKQQVLTSRELSRILGYTRANILHHLAILEADHCIEIIGQRKSTRGRPENLFGLSRQALGNELVGLSSVLIDHALENMKPTECSNYLRNIARRYRALFPDTHTNSFSNMLSQMIQCLNQMHYHARWEASASGALLVFNHCPFWALIDKHPELCSLDKYMLEEWTTRGVRQVSKLQKQDRHLPQCSFMIVN